MAKANVEMEVDCSPLQWGPWGGGGMIDPWGSPLTPATELLHSSVQILLAFSVWQENVVRNQR